MAKKTDLSKMSLDELKQLKKDVDAAIKGYSERQRAEAAGTASRPLIILPKSTA